MRIKLHPWNPTASSCAPSQCPWQLSNASLKLKFISKSSNTCYERSWYMYLWQQDLSTVIWIDRNWQSLSSFFQITILMLYGIFQTPLVLTFRSMPKAYDLSSAWALSTSSWTRSIDLKYLTVLTCSSKRGNVQSYLKSNVITKVSFTCRSIFVNHD